MKKLIGALISLFILSGACPAQAEEEARGDIAYTADLTRMKNDIANTKYRLTLLETTEFVTKSITNVISKRIDGLDEQIAAMDEKIGDLSTDTTNIVIDLVPEWSREATKPVYDYSEITGTPDLTPFITEEVANERFARSSTVEDLAGQFENHQHGFITTANDGAVGGGETRVIVENGSAKIKYIGGILPTPEGPHQETWEKTIATVDQLDGFVNETVTNGLASVEWVNGQGFVDETVTNGLASKGWVNERGFVDESVTNGLASQAWVNAKGFVDKTVTNGLASSAWVSGQGFVTKSVTNGLASVAWVNAQEYVNESITNGLAAKTDIPTKVSELTNDSNFVTRTITNGLASMDWVNSREFVKESVTNGLASRDWVDSKNFVTQTITNGLASKEWVDLKQYVTESVTNGLASTNWVQAQDNAILDQMQAHSHSNIVAGDTRIQAVNGGGAKIIQTKNALSRVTLPAGYTVKNASDAIVYETQSDEVLLFNPKRIPSTQYNQDFWLPYGYEDVETWEDIGNIYQGWVVCSMSHGTDPSMVVKTDIRLMLQISNGTLTPMGNMTASGDPPVYENDIPYDEIEDIARMSDIPNHYVEAVNGIEGRVQIGLLGEDPTFTVTPEYTNGLKLATFAFTNGWEQIQVWPEGVSGGGPEGVSGVQFDVYFPTSAIPDVSSFVTESVTNGLATTAFVQSEIDLAVTLSADAIAPFWQEGAYTNGNFVIYNKHLYECTNATSGAWTDGDWRQTSLSEMMGNLRSILHAINGD